MSSPKQEASIKLPVATSNMTEGEAISYLGDLLKAYTSMDRQLHQEYQKLIKIKESFPKRYIDKENFEDLMLQAASVKFEAIVMARRYSGLAADMAVELEFVRANFKLNIADDALSEKFEKITEGLRDAYVISKLEIKELTKLNDRVNNHADSAEKLIKAFDGDEINFRRIADRKNKLGGFL